MRTENAIEKVPAFIVAVYALLALAAHKTNKIQSERKLPRTKLYPTQSSKSLTTGDMINTFKSQMWAKSININFINFVNMQYSLGSQKNAVNTTISAAFYARKSPNSSDRLIAYRQPTRLGKVHIINTNYQASLQMHFSNP